MHDLASKTSDKTSDNNESTTRYWAETYRHAKLALEHITQIVSSGVVAAPARLFALANKTNNLYLVNRHRITILAKERREPIASLRTAASVVAPRPVGRLGAVLVRGIPGLEALVGRSVSRFSVFRVSRFKGRSVSRFTIGAARLKAVIGAAQWPVPRGVIPATCGRPVVGITRRPITGVGAGATGPRALAPVARRLAAENVGPTFWTRPIACGYVCVGAVGSWQQHMQPARHSKRGANQAT